ncbi:UDP-N-acetylmuramoyl-tripeptide--D-alanyl-D-alanine ligase [Paenibacillus xylaniclasticus]|uniref:UDP-N-acetylmuramoyl-tripeptide--D-alanyl-D- alanine ligase n=1 Tax=Paenibacillus xylaniclasticus TaxID=588083 RepID=UPI000FD75DC6|nr:MULTISPECIES: UDP-N-acetylmuramoyl-tripeptide--D-alanyl-D-alanine ligase [Paenibacillus]GFN30391.1 UDP-N-acetylmuramoyl-tripeptide--D-alanyl-D-alanine ligase [Paenibacillus curdlanolyticus]
MIRRTLGQVARMCGGTLAHGQRDSDIEIAGVTRDSRTAGAGELYVPLIGENFDGHDFAAETLAKGAAASLWEEGIVIPDELQDAPLVLVPDTLSALQRLASAYRDELGLRVIGITGSNGKTTTKDLTAAVLGTVFRVHKTEGNLNNHIGVPLTILQLDEKTETAVLEMGMSDFGEIELLATIASPDAAIITNIGDAHMQQLGSRAGIAQAKLEIAEGLKDGGALIFNGDEPLLRERLASMELLDGTELVPFGDAPDCKWSAANIKVSVDSSTFDVVSPLLTAEEAEALRGVLLPVPGEHNVMNALAAIAAAYRFGVPAASIREGLSNVVLTGMRIQPVTAFNGAKLLNDAYNANPTATRAAIDLVEQLTGYRRKWVVLADMLELGDQEVEMHRSVGSYVTPEKADALLTWGSLAQYIAEGASEAFAAAGRADDVRHFAHKEELASWLREHLHSDDLVLVKGSRGMRMEQVVQALES